MYLRFALCLHLLLVANWGFAQDDENAVAATPVRAASNPLDSDTVFPGYAISLFLSGATPGEMQTFESYALFDDYFDIYSPKPTTPAKNIANTVDNKVGTQAGRIVVDLQIDFTEGQIRDVIDAIQGRRDTPDSATREKLEEIWVVMPDGSIKKFFPGVIK